MFINTSAEESPLTTVARSMSGNVQFHAQDARTSVWRPNCAHTRWKAHSSVHISSIKSSAQGSPADLIAGFSGRDVLGVDRRRKERV